MSNQKIDRAAKVQALAKRAGTPGERQAAEAALKRISGLVVPSPGARLTDAAIKQLVPPASGNRIQIGRAHV